MIINPVDEHAVDLPLHRSETSEGRKHTALLLDVARRYYLDSETQAEIASAISFSRPTVSRLLAEAREVGIVQIRISHPMERVLGIEQELIRTFGLTHARVADPEEPSGAQAEVARCAADLLIEQSSEDVVICVSNGLAVAATVDALPRLIWPRSRVVQMIGSVGPSERLLDSPEICRKMAQRLGGFAGLSFVGTPQTIARNADGAYQLFRIGDAVAARNTHAAIYDALRLAKDI